MRFLLTVYDDERRWASVDERSMKAEIEAYCRRSNIPYLDLLPPLRPLGEQGFVDYDHLSPAGAERVAEAKQQLGGYYLLECESMDEALRWAAKIPAARSGSVEVREVMDYEAAGFPNPAAEAARSA